MCDLASGGSKTGVTEPGEVARVSSAAADAAAKVFASALDGTIAQPVPTVLCGGMHALRWCVHVLCHSILRWYTCIALVYTRIVLGWYTRVAEM